MLVKVLIMLITAQCALSANILFMNDIPSPSHHLWNYAFAKGLIERGHNITMMAPDAYKNFANLTNYHPLNLGIADIFNQFFQEYNMQDLATMNIFSQLLMGTKFSKISCETHLNNPNFRQLRNYPKGYKFDLIIIDTTLNQCFYPFIQQFNYPPTIGVTAFLLPPFLSEYFGNHMFPSYIPLSTFAYSEDMKFTERVWNYLITNLDLFLRYIQEKPSISKLVKKEWPESRDLDELTRHISLLLSNTDPILSIPQPLTPNIIPVGGLHTRPAKPLPSDIQKIVDDSKGIVIFSLGTNVRIDQLHEATLNAIMSTLSKLPYAVLFKSESEIKSEVPKNVAVRQWLPVNDLLGNSKTKLFITHGGALSTQEAMFHGMPMLGIPFIVDQHFNCKMLTERKLGLTQTIDSLTADSFLGKIKTILDNPEIYYKNAQDISKRFRDSPDTPLERAIYWAEYAIRHNGTQFLTPKARDLGYVVKYHKDVEIFLILIVVIAAYLTRKVLFSVLGLFTTKSKSKVE